MPGDWYFGWHRTTRRQYVVNLDAPHQVTASDGEVGVIGSGEIYMVEICTAKAISPKGWDSPVARS